MSNPLIAEVTRGGIVESSHTGAFAVVDRQGRLVASAGAIGVQVFPRSAIKAFQCLPVIESGAAGRFGFTDEEIALACSSHSGEPEHVRVARSMLLKAETSEAAYECGAHWPIEERASHAAVRSGMEALAVYNNCSGKHAGMLALARALGADAKDYVTRQHPVQRTIAATIGRMCDCDLDSLPCGVDGCSVPTWAIPLRNLALGFARFTDPGNAAARRIVEAVRRHPFMVAGTGRFDTDLMQALPRVFVKTGAEGVYCGCIPHAGLGIALKCDDGAGRAAEMAMASVLARLEVWTPDEQAVIGKFAHRSLENWRHIRVGELRAVS